MAEPFDLYDEWREAAQGPNSEFNVTKIILRWALNRLDAFGYRTESISANNETIHVDTVYDDICRGCYMGTITKHYEIPYEVFISDLSLEAWIKDEDAKQAEQERIRKEKERQAQLQATENHERRELERLKKKFGEE